MKIAFDVSPLESGHKVRGIGYYVENLKKELLTNSKQFSFQFFSKTQDIENDVRIIHYPYFDPFFLTLFVPKKYSIVVTVHDLIPLVFPEHFPVGIRGKLKWLRQKSNLRKAQAVITDSFSSKQDIIRIAGIPAEKISVVYLAASDNFQPMDKENPLLVKVKNKYHLPDKFLLYVGDVTWNKNLPNLIKAIKNTGIPLVLAGKALSNELIPDVNPWNNDLREVNRLTIGDPEIIRPGFIADEDIVALYNLATVFILPSVYEGFGLPVLEAMQSGCPVITTKRGSLPEITGDAAFYVQPEDIADIRLGIQKLFTDRNLRDKLRIQGLKQAEKFTWKSAAENTTAIYEKISKR